MLEHGLLKYWWLLFQHCKRIDQRTDIFRNIEDAFALKHAFACVETGKVYLDIGSGASPLPTYVYKELECTVFATDFEDSWLERQRAYLAKLDLSLDKFITQPEDATELSFADCSVDLLTAVFTIEHIPGDGDTRAMREFQRILRPGGRLIVTVPTSASYTEQTSTFYYAGFERRYDGAALHSRLGMSGLFLTEQLYMTSPPQTTIERIKEEFREVHQLENLFEVWYKRGYHEIYPDVSILLTLGLIRLSEVPVKDSFGACLAFVKT